MSFLRELELNEVSRVRQLLGNEINVLRNYNESKGSIPQQYNFIMNVLKKSSEGSDTLLKNSCWPVFGIHLVSMRQRQLFSQMINIHSSNQILKRDLQVWLYEN